MINKKVPINILLALGMALVFIPDVLACRFWCVIGPDLNGVDMVNELVDAPESLKKLGREYPDGWSVGYINPDQVSVERSDLPSYRDKTFAGAVKEANAKNADVVVAHLRKASSGCRENVPNPHPFVRVVNGELWMFGHNGGIDKYLLMGQIGQDDLDLFPPETCTEDPPHSWVDSELYFLYLAKYIREYENPHQGIKMALLSLNQKIAPGDQYLNFFLTNGKELWAFRRGNSLHVKYDSLHKRFFVSSTVPDPEQTGWSEVREGELYYVRKGQMPQREKLW